LIEVFVFFFDSFFFLHEGNRKKRYIRARYFFFKCFGFFVFVLLFIRLRSEERKEKNRKGKRKEKERKKKGKDFFF